ncbi:MAG TPA: PD-(D/E)XK nuclease family protein [Solirubrobacterales bacterium]|nr:PD-(D/E)XK nuclease family protein [Solirubrobacterales bacterium]
MPLNLIHGPPNSGRIGLILARFTAGLEHNPVLVVPNMDEVFRIERELCKDGAVLGGSVMTFGAFFRTVAMAGGAPPGAELTPAQRLRAISVAIAERRRELGPLRNSTARPGFAFAFERLLDELQGAGLDAEAVQRGTATLEGSAYLSDIATLFAGYTEVRDRLGRVDPHQIAGEAISLLRASGEFWRERPVFLYGFDDLTPNEFELVAALCGAAEVTIALPYEEGHAILRQRDALLNRLRERVGGSEETLPADPRNTEDPLLFHLERGFGAIDAERLPPGDGLTLLRSAGERGEAEAIGVEVAKLVAGGVDPAEIAIALRDPARRGPLVASVLESYGIATALEAELPVAATAVGGGLIALLEAEFGARRASNLLRFLRGPSGAPPGKVDWLERAIRRGRVRSAADALELWRGEGGDLPADLARLRKAAGGPPAHLAEEVGRLVVRIGSRTPREEPETATAVAGLESRAAAAISSALSDLCEMGDLAPRPEELAGVLAGIRFRAWSGPVGGRVRIADPYRLRAGRFDHVLVGSLQDGEFPRHAEGGDPFLSEQQRGSLGLDPRRDTDAEERYLFYACLSLPRKSLFLSYRDSDENGAAEARSPLLDDVRRMLAPPPSGESPDPVEESIVRERDLTRVVSPVAEAPSENELARAIAAHGHGADPRALLAIAEADAKTGERIEARLGAAAVTEAASRAPGPLRNPAALESLAAVSAYGGTTLEEFDVCSYRWFAGHELDPQRLDPTPDPLVQGGLMHAALDRLYRERPGGDPLPRPGSLDAWTARGRELATAIASERELGGHPAERAIVRRVERLLARFLAEEARRETGGFEPWLLEAAFGEHEDSERPVLEIDDWGLHGAIDRVDRAPDGRALVLDYKLAGSVTPREKFEEKAKLQLQLYLIAVAEHWGGEPVGGLYHPLRGTSVRRPRGAVLDEAAEDLGSYELYRNDLVDRAGLEELLDDARRRAGAIVARMRAGDIRRDPGPRRGLRDHDVCPTFCEFAPICRRDRAPAGEENGNGMERER